MKLNKIGQLVVEYVLFNQKCNAHRIRITDDFIKATKYRIPLLIDPVSENNPFSKVYSPWPIRFYVINHIKKFSYISQPIQGLFSLKLIKNASIKVFFSLRNNDYYLLL
ncbi:unnamed protein product [Rotaria sordida]|uniref:Uncharacterized protein n=1 Tax=Rotaria sordida TaxID=392033 RepID=A0A814RUM9_9BILA|nr:unnamed protein product [Rotaria sordida]CAF1226925.1 unnamed protein product [Rotaria sordida]CAF3735472.1 unnamed protein product [Rotaria sordida]CAF4117059.1 unnamed protein product [Rotaria sordida]